MSEAAEKFLFEHGIIQRSSLQRREVLGCIACRWGAKASDTEPKVYGYQIIKCTGIRSSSLYPFLNDLSDAGVIEPYNEIIDKSSKGRLGGPVRKTYTPVGSELGEEFQAKLVVPEGCRLTDKELMLADLPVIESYPDRSDRTQ